MQENYILEKRIFDELISTIRSDHKELSIEQRLNELLSVASSNYFCRGIKMGMQIAISLDKNASPETEE